MNVLAPCPSHQPKALLKRLIRFLKARGRIVNALGKKKRELRELAAEELGVTLSGTNHEKDWQVHAALSSGSALRLPAPDSTARRKERQAFYDSEQWRRVRYQALVLHGGACQCCGARGSAKSPLHVDHIKPRSKYPALALKLDNLQVLCRDCNLGKSNSDQTDWRPRDPWVEAVDCVLEVRRA